ncbi:MAG: hypothetical protein A2X23_05630 [Chloroflexi bacterium GWC2_73_18]|nr:MAG: hypothetical protein A2X23_05630 [Chloroflexi bacterium GWC2_73_18]
MIGEPWLALLYATFFSVVLANLLCFAAIHRVGTARAALLSTWSRSTASSSAGRAGRRSPSRASEVG